MTPHPTASPVSAPAHRLALQGIGKRFDNGVVACSDVSLDVAPRSVHAIVGENGAGKSTVLKMIYGLERPTAGAMWVDGRPHRPEGPAQAQALGVGLVPQHLQLLPSASVAENVLLGCEPSGRFGQIDRRAAEERVRSLAGRFGLALDPQARVGELAAGAQQRVAILKALRQPASLLLMDEPTALLAPHEADALFASLLALRDQGLSIVLVSHKLAEVRQVCSTCTVMRAGRVVGGGAVGQFSDDELGELIVGRRVVPESPRRVDARGRTPRLRVRGLVGSDERGRREIDGVDLDVAAGEILGIAGVEGNGQNRLADALTGLHPALHGEVTIDGRPLSLSSPQAARSQGVGSVAEDRMHGGVAPGLSITDNAAALDHGHPPQSRWGWLRPAAMAARARQQIEAYGVRAAGEGVPIGTLSGGNIQKLLVARELAARPRFLVAAQPTRGVDLGAVRRLRQALRDARDEGCAVLLISAELDELLEMSDRLAVMFQGRIVAHLRPDQVDPRQLGRFMTGLLQDPRARATLDAPFTEPDRLREGAPHE